MPQGSMRPCQKPMGERCFGTLFKKLSDCHSERMDLISYSVT